MKKFKTWQIHQNNQTTGECSSVRHTYNVKAIITIPGAFCVIKGVVYMVCRFYHWMPYHLMLSSNIKRKITYHICYWHMVLDWPMNSVILMISLPIGQWNQSFWRTLGICSCIASPIFRSSQALFCIMKWGKH